MIVGKDGPAVVISARTAHYLETAGRLTELRVHARGRDPLVAQELLDIREAALRYRLPACAEVEAPVAEVGPELESWMTPMEVADLLSITDRAVRLACHDGRIEAEQQAGGRWRISREAFEQFKSARAA